jgi:hypothetical protein
MSFGIASQAFQRRANKGILFADHHRLAFLTRHSIGYRGVDPLQQRVPSAERTNFRFYRCTQEFRRDIIGDAILISFTTDTLIRRKIAFSASHTAVRPMQYNDFAATIISHEHGWPVARAVWYKS